MLQYAAAPLLRGVVLQRWMQHCLLHQRHADWINDGSMLALALCQCNRQVHHYTGVIIEALLHCAPAGTPVSASWLSLRAVQMSACQLTASHVVCKLSRWLPTCIHNTGILQWEPHLTL